MESVTVGIDGITCIVNRNLVQQETFLPSQEHYFIKLTPKGSNTEVAIILPRTVRDNNNIGFRQTDLKALDETITLITKQLKSVNNGVIGIEDCCVKQLEVALTVDLKNTDDVTIDSLLKLFSNVLLINETRDQENKNKAICSPQQRYITAKQLKQDYYFIKQECIKSFETSLWSNRRLKFKAYSKGSGSAFGGVSSIFRFETLYCEKGMKKILKNKENITLQDVLTKAVLKRFITAFKEDYTEIVSPRLRGYLKDSKRLIYEQLHTTSTFNALLITLPYIVDIDVYRVALKKYYKEQGKSDAAFRKMYSNVLKKIKQNEDIKISNRVISILESMKKHTEM